MAAAHAAPRCNFWRADGRRCSAPALRGRRRCHFHNRLFRPQRRNYALPILEDAASIHLALLQVTRALAEDGMTADQGRLVLYALQLASANVRNLQTASESDSDAPVTPWPDDPLPVE